MFDWIGTQLGPWTWWVIGLLLLAMEVVIPGIFLMWFGIAAIIVGSLSLMLWTESYWIWQMQVIIFAVLAVISALIGRRMIGGQDGVSDEPLLNQRGASLIGRTATLKAPIHEGRGRIHVDDTTWVVNGPDLPVGSRVRIVSSTGNTLKVEPVSEISAPA
ncbi:MAG: membrane protein [Rhizobiaceae bacterium MnEN-MB40S]|nr:MAG: membrane protein [Rhizobiaceae bacterium MnEN-MB40S]